MRNRLRPKKIHFNELNIFGQSRTLCSKGRANNAKKIYKLILTSEWDEVTCEECRSKYNLRKKKLDRN